MSGKSKIDNTKKSEKMGRTITSLSFRSGTGSPDNDLIALANDYAKLPENQGINPTPLLRNLFIRKLKEAMLNAETAPRIAG